MSKMQAVFVSGILLMPAGGFLAYIMIMMFMNHAGDVKMMMQVTAGIASLCGVMAALMPIAILLFMPGGGTAVKAPAKAKEKAGKGAETVPEESEEASSEAGMESEETIIESADEFAEAPSEDFETMDFDSSSIEEAASDLDDFDMEFEEEEEKPKPKKKGKK